MQCYERPRLCLLSLCTNTVDNSIENFCEINFETIYRPFGENLLFIGRIEFQCIIWIGSMVENCLDDDEKYKLRVTRIWFTYFILLYFSQKEIENAQTGKTNTKCQMAGRVRPVDAVRSKCQTNANV